MTQEIPACAAIRLDRGEIIAGHRHHNCLAMMKRLGVGGLGRIASVQGFMTNRGRFVNRDEARKLFDDAGMVSACPSGLRATELYSEDLY